MFQTEYSKPVSALVAMKDEEVIEFLTQIKGVGRWTVEMLLMFTLGREDLFAIDDLGLQNAVIKLYKFTIKSANKSLENSFVVDAAIRTVDDVVVTKL